MDEQHRSQREIVISKILKMVHLRNDCPTFVLNEAKKIADEYLSELILGNDLNLSEFVYYQRYVKNYTNA